MNTKKMYTSPKLICVEMETESPIAASVAKGSFSTAPTSALQMLD